MIHGQITCLRPIEAADVDHLLRWQSDAAVMRWWGQLAPLLTRAEIERDVAGRFAATDGCLYLLIETNDGRPVGRLDVERIDARHRGAEVMLYIGESAAHGNGYGTDALAAACRYLFEQRGIHRVALTVMAANARAIAVYERLGFRPEGTLRHHLWMDGAPVDEVAMSLLAGELQDVP